MKANPVSFNGIYYAKDLKAVAENNPDFIFDKDKVKYQKAKKATGKEGFLLFTTVENDKKSGNLTAVFEKCGLKENIDFYRLDYIV